jgi:hypothetical protein
MPLPTLHTHVRVVTPLIAPRRLVLVLATAAFCLTACGSSPGGSTTHAVDPSPCVQYDGCDSTDPVIWCSVPNEGHAIPSFGAQAVATFFSQF